MIDILLITAVFAAVLFAENTLARRYGHYPTLAAILTPFCLLVAADDYGNGRYFSAAAAVLLAVVAVALIRDARTRA